MFSLNDLYYLHNLRKKTTNSKSADHRKQQHMDYTALQTVTYIDNTLV